MNFRKIFVFIILILLIGFFSPRLGNTAIEEVVIREYEGEDLSSINDFRENSILGPQYIDIQSYSLIIEGLVENRLSLSYEEVLDSFESVKKIVTLNCIEGWSVKILWEGFLIEELFQLAEVESKANTVIFYAHDGYTTSLPLNYIIENNIIIAYKMNNVTLPPERGFPFELVAESKYGYKWIKWITRIELSDEEEYAGYWESRGYSNEANINSGSGQPPSSTFNPIPTPFPTPTPAPTAAPTPTIEPSPTSTFDPTNTPSPTPITENTNLTWEFIGVGSAIIIGAFILFFILKKKKSPN